MLKSNFAVYLGQEKEGNFLGFVAEGNLFLILEIGQDFSKEEGRIFLHQILEDISHREIKNLTTFEKTLTERAHQANLPLDFSLAAGYVKDGVFYLKTFNEGEIYIKRGRDLLKIIGNNNMASGFMIEKDYFIFTTAAFNAILGGITSIKNKFDKKPTMIVEELIPELKGRNDKGVISLFVYFDSAPSFVQTSPMLCPEKKQLPKFKLLDILREKFYRLNNLPESYKKKRLTFILVLVVLIILIWSVGFGYSRRLESQQIEKINKTKELVTTKIKEADEAAFFNLSQALVLVSQAKTKVNNLKQEVDKKHNAKIKEIEDLVAAEEAKLLKKEEKNYEEFFDLTVDNKDARGEKLYLNLDSLNILDKQKSVIYSLSLVKKSLDKASSSDIKSASLIASYEDLVFYFVPNEGIFKVTNGKSKKIISNDKDWKEIIAMNVYNGNVYLLARGNDEVYKYLVAQSGYSEKQSYFTAGSAVDLSDSNSMAIDSAVYVGFSNYVGKYISGIRDEFKTNFPQENVTLTKIFTNKQLDKVYAWDKTGGVVYIFDKKGTYEKQVKSTIFSKAINFVVFENSAYMLFGAKIYKVDL